MDEFINDKGNIIGYDDCNILTKESIDAYKYDITCCKDCYRFNICISSKTNYMEAMVKKSFDFYDSIDFTKFINKRLRRINVRDLMDKLDQYYDLNNPQLLPSEFQGCFFNFINEDEFAEYLSKRYEFKDITEVIEKHWLVRE